MALYRDVFPVAHVQKWDDVNEAVTEAITNLVEKKHLAVGDRVLITMGNSVGNEGGTNTLRLVQVGTDGHADHQAELDLE